MAKITTGRLFCSGHGCSPETAFSSRDLESLGKAEVPGLPVGLDHCLGHSDSFMVRKARRHFGVPLQVRAAELSVERGAQQATPVGCRSFSNVELTECAMQHPLLAFLDWFLAQDASVRDDVASFIFLGLPDSRIDNSQFIEDDMSDLLKAWIDEQISKGQCRVLGTAIAVRSVIEFFLMSTRSSPARSDSLELVTDGTLGTSELLSSTAWRQARQGWASLCLGALSDSGLDAWGQAESVRLSTKPGAATEFL